MVMRDPNGQQYSKCWTVQHDTEGGCTIYDDLGTIVGRYANRSIQSAHHACALQEVRRLQRALQEARHVIDKGLKARVNEMWPALNDVLQPTLDLIDETLCPKMEVIPVDNENA